MKRTCDYNSERNTENNISSLMKQIDEDYPTLGVFLTEEGDVFQRVVSFSSKSELKMIEPTSDQGLFESLLSLDGDLVGFFCGDPDEWIPILLRDQYLSSGCNSWIAIIDLIFPKDTICIRHERSVNFIGCESIIDEFFIVYDKPLKPTNIHVLSQSEMEEYELKVDEITEGYDEFT